MRCHHELGVRSRGLRGCWTAGMPEHHKEHQKWDEDEEDMPHHDCDAKLDVRCKVDRCAPFQSDLRRLNVKPVSGSGLASIAASWTYVVSVPHMGPFGIALSDQGRSMTLYRAIVRKNVRECVAQGCNLSVTGLALQFANFRSRPGDGHI